MENENKDIIKKNLSQIIREPYYKLQMAIFDELHKYDNYTSWYNTSYNYTDITTKIDIPLILTFKDFNETGK